MIDTDLVPCASREQSGEMILTVDIVTCVARPVHVSRLVSLCRVNDRTKDSERKHRLNYSIVKQRDTGTAEAKAISSGVAKLEELAQQPTYQHEGMLNMISLLE